MRKRNRILDFIFLLYCFRISSAEVVFQLGRTTVLPFWWVFAILLIEKWTFLSINRISRNKLQKHLWTIDKNICLLCTWTLFCTTFLRIAEGMKYLQGEVFVQSKVFKVRCWNDRVVYVRGCKRFAFEFIWNLNNLCIDN